MADIKQVIENPDGPAPRREDRELVLKHWNREQAQGTAAEEGIQLTDEHWQVIDCLRDFYLNRGPAENGREVGDMLDAEFAEQGGRGYLRRLFPNGPVGQGLRIAGLPVPPHTEDEGFGTSR